MIVLKAEVMALNVDDFHDLVMAVIQLELIDEGYARLGIDKPKWLTEKYRDANTELKYRLRSSKERKLEEAKMRREQLKTSGQKREDTDDEIRRLEEELA